jgi:asparagine synthase (glutamine-hydrolysing)
MSILFGIREAEGEDAEERRLQQLAVPTARYALDGTFISTSGRVGMGLQPFHTHLRSTYESRPAASIAGNMITFDGRLDNYVDLCKLLDLDATATKDSVIALAAFEHWGEDCFSHFSGDWALALWARAERTLYLARDHAGTRTLYFQQSGGRLIWSTYLETFPNVERSTDLDLVFAESYLARRAVRDLTPYRNIRAVPPAQYLKCQDATIVGRQHWHSIARDQILYKTDGEYEEHFMALFRRAVENRTGPGAPVLAELSGGMDSSSIVCMSDRLRAEEGISSAGFLDTISFYSDSEPNWNEKPYFGAVEARRGKAGVHVSSSHLVPTLCPPDGTYLLPGADSGTLEREQRWMVAVGLHKYRAILSGVGGDEVLGGVPTAMPELADYLIGGDFRKLIGRSITWCKVDGSPLVYCLLNTARFTLDLYCSDITRSGANPPWIRTHALTTGASRPPSVYTKWTRGLTRPSSLGNERAWLAVIESLPTRSPATLMRPEYRYPYLDKSLVEFLFRLPPRQLVEPGRRRSLMRRALKDVLPREIVERRRKAYCIDHQLRTITQNQEKIVALLENSRLADLAVIEPRTAKAAINEICSGKDVRFLPYLLRLIALELWLQSGTGHAPAGTHIPNQYLSLEKGRNEIRKAQAV